MGKLFRLSGKGGHKATMWCAQTQNSGEIATVLLNKSEEFRLLEPGIQALMQRKDAEGQSTVVPKIHFTDNQPINRDNFFRVMESLQTQATDLRHFFALLIDRMNKFSPLFTPLCQRLSRIFLRFDANDVREQLALLLHGGMHKGGKVMTGHSPSGKPLMHVFQGPEDQLSMETVCGMLGHVNCTKCQLGKYAILISSLQLKCTTCDHTMCILTDPRLSSKCPFYTTRSNAIRRNCVHPLEVEQGMQALLRDVNGAGPDGTDWGKTYKGASSGGAPMFVTQLGFKEQLITCISKLKYVYIDPNLGIPRYRASPFTDSLGSKVYISLNETTGVESKFSVLEGAHTAHGGYEPQALSDSLLHQVDVTNTMCRRKNLCEPNVVHVNLHLARSHDMVRELLGLYRLHPWLPFLQADTGERFLYDFYQQQGRLEASTITSTAASGTAAAGSAASSTAAGGIAAGSAVGSSGTVLSPSVGAKELFDPWISGAGLGHHDAGVLGSSLAKPTFVGPVPSARELGGTQLQRDLAPLAVSFLRASEMSQGMQRAVTTEQRSRTSDVNSAMAKDKFTLLCEKAGVPASEQLRHYFNMGVPAVRMKPDRGIVLCRLDGPCYADAMLRGKGKEVMRQPRIHHVSCMYKQLELVQQQGRR